MAHHRHDTDHVHAPRRRPARFRALTTPIERASTVVFEDLAAFEARAEQLYDGFSYGLYGTPTSRALEQHLAHLEGAARALVTPSGLSAIAIATLACVRAGDRVLMPDAFYGPARELAHRFLVPLGIGVDIYDPRLDGDIAEILTDKTRLIWVESPGSNTFEVQDVPAIVAAAQRHGVVVAADNTWGSHLLFKPLGHGVDIAMQALSKHAGGHGDLLMGSLATCDEALFRRLKDTMRLLGYGVSPDDCALCERGLKTMPIRMRQSADSAARVMAWLKRRPEVVRILHPSEPDHPGHAVWRRDFGGSAGVFGVVLRPAPREAQAAALKAMRHMQIGASWGGVHSLVAPSDPRKGRRFCDWLPDGTYWRLSIGIEDPEDIIADLDEALAVFAGRRPHRRPTGLEDAAE